MGPQAMWGLDPPVVTVEESATACAERMTDRELAARVLAAKPSFVSNNARLRHAVENEQTHAAKDTEYPLPDLSSAELHFLYTTRMAGGKGPARRIYDQILNGAYLGLCSYCRYGQAHTLDHFVPKSFIPALSIDPWNLIPACGQCNSKLSSGYSEDSDKQMFHPYASSTRFGRWLQAEVLPGEPVVVRFSAEPEASLDGDTRRRVINQFKRLELASRYAVVSATDLTEIEAMLTTNFRGFKKDEVREYLLEVSASVFETDPNSRRGALYEALAAEDSYCEKFLRIGTPEHRWDRMS